LAIIKPNKGNVFVFPSRKFPFVLRNLTQVNSPMSRPLAKLSSVDPLRKGGIAELKN